MLFNSLLFIAFFAVVYAVVCLLRNDVVKRNIFLLLAGWCFYGAWDWRFLFLLIGTSTFDYFVARLIDDTDHALVRRRKVLLAASIACNLLVLGFFKYCNFFIDSFIQLAHYIGWDAHGRTIDILLPVGISFYTFQSIAYVVDVYRGHLRAERNLLHYATFVGFFPQLVAGPIERATHLLPQIKSPSVISWDNIHHGFCLASLGMFKKIVLADNVSKVADAVFGTPHAPVEGTPVWWNTVLGIYAFSLQIYCDFSAYSDIARGIARMMGFDLMRNFDLPYLAVNPSDFWRRWHISLSTWLRDYLYIALGGNRGGRLATYRNLMLTMVLGGFWHGATWLFVLWGVYHGLLLCVHRALKPLLDKYFTIRNRFAAGTWTVVRIVVFFQFIAFGWLLFRGPTLQNVARLLGRSIDKAAWPAQNYLTPPMIATLCAVALVLLAAELVKYLSNDHDVIFRIPVPVRAMIYAALMLGMVIYGEFGGGTFIYFQF
ncbi:MAG: MBOAT family protein [Burkholderiales bacterium]|nr:MBOAT family protein [Phycisphaerae bacterium]